MGEILLHETLGLQTSLTDEERRSLRSSIQEIKDSVDPHVRKPTLMVRLDATHAGFPTGNDTIYEPQWMALNVSSFTDPYERPVLTHHDKLQDAIGRVKEGVYIDTPELGPDAPKGHIQLLTSITDEDAIEKILDGRLQTVSIGASSKDVRCSICGQNLAEDGLCSHMKGKTYEDDDGNKKKCYWLVGQLTYREVSFVNSPADARAKVSGMELLTPSIMNSQDDNLVGVQFMYDSMQNKDQGDTYAAIADALDQLDFSDSKLSDQSLAELPDDVFCGPGRTFPVPDARHAAAIFHVIRNMEDTPSRCRIQAAVRARVRQEKWNLDGSTAKYPEEGNSNVANKLSQDDVRFLESFSVGYADTIPKDAEDQEMFVYAHNLLHAAYDHIDDDNAEIPKAHLEIHKSIHTHADILKHLKPGTLDEYLETSSDEEGSRADTNKDDQNSSAITSVEDTVDLTDEQLAAVEDSLANELKAKLDEAKLSYQARKKLPDSAFCGPDRSFPAHDAAHVRNGLARLPQAKMSAETKRKILACLKRRAKKFGVKVGEKSKNTVKNAVAEFTVDVQVLPLEDATLDDILALDIIQDHINSLNKEHTATKETFDEMKQAKEELETSLSTAENELKQAKQKITELEQQLSEDQDDLDQALDESQKMQKKMHTILVDKLIDRRIQLKKPDTLEIINSDCEDDRKEKRAALVSSYMEKSPDALSSLLADLDDEIRALGGGNGVTGTIKNPGITTQESTPGTKKQKKSLEDCKTKQERVLWFLGFDTIDSNDEHASTQSEEER